MRRLPVPLIYALIFTMTLQFSSLFALGGSLQDRFGLSTFQLGAIFAATGFAQIATAVPIGQLVDRHGARRFALLGGTVAGISGLGLGLATGFEMLVGFRALFGLGTVAILTACPTWLADTVTPARRATAVAAVMPVAALGGIVGPPGMGALADEFGVRVPLLLMGVVAFVGTAVVALAPPGGRGVHAHRPFREVIHLVGRQRLVLGGVLLFGIGGAAESVTSVLGPLRLSDNGLSARTIGLVLSAGAILFVPVSLVVAGHAARLASLRTAAIALFALAVVLLPLAASTATGSVAAGLTLRMSVLGGIYALAMPLAAVGAERAALAGGAVFALLQLSVGFANAGGPLLAGGLAEATSERTVYLCTMAVCLAAASWMALAAAKERRAPPP